MAAERLAAAAAWLRRRRGVQTRRTRSRVWRSSLVLVGLDQHPVRVARADIAAERPQVARLHRVAHRAGNDLARGIPGDGGNVGFEADGDYGDAALRRGFR